MVRSWLTQILIVGFSHSLLLVALQGCCTVETPPRERDASIWEVDLKAAGLEGCEFLVVKKDTSAGPVLFGLVVTNEGKLEVYAGKMTIKEKGTFEADIYQKSLERGHPATYSGSLRSGKLVVSTENKVCELKLKGTN